MADMDIGAKERDDKLATDQKATMDMIAALAQQVSQLQNQYISTPNHTNIPNGISKSDQIRDLMAQVKNDPVYALRTFFEGSTIIESDNTRLDVANLDTLEED